MVVQHNLTAMNSNRMLGITTKSQAKSTEKLSSGYKINRAADDAAGLSISEKMRKQIRGLTQASANAQDGISAVQTAEGALTEVHDMLQRMNELAVKAANGTQSKDDRDYIQAEVDQLVTEIDRVATTTKFNESYLLKGTNNNGTVGALTFDTATTNIGSKIYAGGTAATISFDADGIATMELASTAALSVSTSTGKWGESTSDVTSTSGTATVAGKQLTVNGKSFILYDGATDEMLKADAFTAAANSTDTGVATSFASGEVADVNTTGGTAPFYFTDKSKFIDAIKTEIEGMKLSSDIKNLKIDEDGKVTVTAFADLNKGLDVSLHVGADSTKDNKIGLTIEMMSARGLGVNGLKVDGEDFDNATKAIDTIKSAIQKVSEQRSNLGAVQNRLEHTINNLDNVVENTQSAESAIRDTDMAKQMVQYSNNNILAQAGQAMLAQANQSNQGVLSLLG